MTGPEPPADGAGPEDELTDDELRDLIEQQSGEEDPEGGDAR